jgi:hypothetical protein
MPYYLYLLPSIYIILDFKKSPAAVNGSRVRYFV